MIAGVVRKKSRMKRMMLMIKQRSHQETPPNDRCSLEEKLREVIDSSPTQAAHKQGNRKILHIKRPLHLIQQQNANYVHFRSLSLFQHFSCNWLLQIKRIFNICAVRLVDGSFQTPPKMLDFRVWRSRFRSGESHFSEILRLVRRCSEASFSYTISAPSNLHTDLSQKEHFIISLIKIAQFVLIVQSKKICSCSKVPPFLCLQYSRVSCGFPKTHALIQSRV